MDGFRTPLQIAASHPALPGHFPGHPVVPGVVLLERVAAALKAWRGVEVAALDVKFLQPLSPEETAFVELDEHAGRVRFRVDREDGATLARGTLEVAP